MDTAAKHAPDLRTYLAAERTFLAWIRTGVGCMGFGFVVARFGIFLREMGLLKNASSVQSYGPSPWLGTGPGRCRSVDERDFGMASRAIGWAVESG